MSSYEGPWELCDFRENPRYFGDLAPNVENPALSTSSRYFSFGTADGNIAFLPIDFTSDLIAEKAASGRRAEYGTKVFTTPFLPTCNNGGEVNVSSTQFNPFDPLQLASVHNDGCVKLWTLPTSPSGARVDAPSMEIAGGEPVYTCAFHPSANSLLAVGGGSGIAMLDISQESSVLSSGGLDSVVSGLSFNKDGSTLFGITTNAYTDSGTNHLLVFDPRSGAAGVDTIARDIKMSPESVECLHGVGESYVAVSGVNSFREPAVSVFDTRALDQPVFKIKYDHKGTKPISAYCPYTNLFYLTFTMVADVTLYDASGGMFEKIISHHGAETLFRDMTLLPKVSTKRREVNRLVKICEDRAEVLPCVRDNGGVVYKTKHRSEPVMSPEEYLGGANADRFLEVEFAGDEDQKDTDERTNSRFLHCAGSTSTNTAQHYTSIITFNGTLPLARNIKVNSQFIAFPARATAGGSLAILDKHVLGRQSRLQKEIRAHAEQITSFDISIVQPNFVATGAPDCKVFVWELPTTGASFVEAPVRKVLELQHRGRVSLVAFHPYVPDVLVTSDRDMEESWLHVWDVRSGAEKYTIDLPMSADDAVFGPNGSMLAVSSNGKVFVYDIRQQNLVCEFDPLESKRGITLFWAYEDALITMGFDDKSKRRFSMWDISDSSNPVMEATFVRDVSNSIPFGYYDYENKVLYHASVSDQRIRVFSFEKRGEISEMVGNYFNPAQTMGMAFGLKEDLDVRKCQVGKCYQLTSESIMPVSFEVPRKRKTFFQDDLYPMFPASRAWMSADEWFDGNTAHRSSVEQVSLQPADMTALSDAPQEELTAKQKKYQEEKAKRLSARKTDTNKPRNEQEAFAAFGRVVEGAAVTNRWDATPLASSEVADDEWDD